jgi:hypothetical protein
VPEGWPLDQEMPGRGCLFVGDKGSLICAGLGAKPMLLPEERNEAYKAPAPTIPRSKGHHRDWVDACKGGPAASSHFEYGARLTELLLLGVLSLRTGKPIRWDGANMKANGNRMPRRSSNRIGRVGSWAKLLHRQKRHGLLVP